ncbi:hypothetical protein [Aquicella lusitana]|mgnify:CR=1 FL=1|jgi:Anti-sigma-28 factor, FlgM.|uniref:Anti-sigma-28 factor FlgM n=1 Tax=Aquicella lusitana TaxID=254246 RepID=A0A370G862_9COXI|nr:hypothetical protein [Aquicella lusitana]RDI39971.1 hypothetical protein C8D86_12532 [Aquicella lusitana]VVC74574.1 hypothetical protein AQULUS_23400 [Aquicella lusitana]
MVNEIKLDKINSYYSSDRTTQNNSQPSPNTAQKDVDVTNHLNDLVKSINTYQEPVGAASLNALKYQIEQHEYKVDLDQLSDRLLSSGLLTIGD